MNSSQVFPAPWGKLGRAWNRIETECALRTIADLLSGLLDAGIPLQAALQHLIGGRLSRVEQRLLSLALAGIDQGRPLSESWSNEAPTIFLALLQAGEYSGGVSTVLQSWMRQQERRSYFRSQLVRVFAYPAVLLVVSGVLLTFIATVIFPAFADMYHEMGVQATGSILALRWWVRTLPWMLLIAFAAVLLLSLLFGLIRRRNRRLWSSMQVFIPGFSLLRQARTSVFCELMQMLLQAGIPISDALHELADFRHPAWLREQSQDIEQKILRGQSLQVSFGNNWDPLLNWMVTWAEQTGDLQMACGRVHAGTEKLFLTRVRHWGKILEPTVLLLLGLFVGFTMYALFAPMYDLTTVITSAGVGQ